MIVSQITARQVFGQNPSGFVPQVPSANSLQTINFTETFEYSTVAFTVNDIPATQDDFLAQVKLDLDTNWAPGLFTDATKTYNVEYQIRSVVLGFTTVENSPSIWCERTYAYTVAITALVNVI